MGMVVDFARHATSRLKPKTLRSNSKPRRSSSAEKITKYSGGIAPEAFQLLAADLPTPAISAAAVDPPSASMTCSTEQSMTLNSSTNLNLSRVQNIEIESSHHVNFYRPMASKRDEIAKRLRFLPKTFGMQDQDFARSIGVSKTTWSNWNSEKRDERITADAAMQLWIVHRIPMEWTYLGDAGLILVLHDDVRQKLLKVQRLADEAEKPPRRHSRAR